MTTISNASKQQLANFIEECTGEAQDIQDMERDELESRARWCVSHSDEWFGEHINFKSWANPS